MIRRIIEKIKSLRNEWYYESNVSHLKKTDKIYLSFGDNCLPYNIIDLQKKKSLTTPFSHGRSNIEYILNLEKDSYRDFVNEGYLRFENLNGAEVPRLKTYLEITNEYNELHMNGFEFTHHDVINNPELRNKFKERVMGMKSYLGKKKYVIFYHNRFCAETDQDMLIDHLLELKKIYSAPQLECEIVLFKQKIIDDSRRRGLQHYLKNRIHIFDFYTTDIWGGEDPNLLWARNDDDLIRKMISKMKKI
jgi:hypothetical protein